MMTPAFFKRSQLTRILWSFRREFAVVGLLSVIANVLMLSPTLYMLQIYDRVLRSHSELTLLMISLIIFVFLVVMAFAEWIRTRLLVRAGVRFDEALNDRIFRAGFRAELEQSGHNPGQALGDLANIRQFLTGNGTIAFFDAPWTPIYIAVMFMLHPWLGWLSIFFVANLVILAVVEPAAVGRSRRGRGEGRSRGQRVSVQQAAQFGSRSSRWACWATCAAVGPHRQQNYLRVQSAGRRREPADMTAFVKFIRYTQQSLSLGAGALLAIKGEITIGSMIAANMLMSRASQPIEVIVTTWGSFPVGPKRLRPHRKPARRASRVRSPATASRRRPARSSLQGLVATAPNRAEPILKTLDIEFPAGQLTAIIGPSGSGKSTLARTLIGIWPYTEGKVLLDGHPLEAGTAPRSASRSATCRRTSNCSKARSPTTSRASARSRPRQVIDAAQRAGHARDDPAHAEGLRHADRRGRAACCRAASASASALPARSTAIRRLIVLDEPNANLDEPATRR